MERLAILCSSKQDGAALGGAISQLLERNRQRRRENSTSPYYHEKGPEGGPSFIAFTVFQESRSSQENDVISAS